MIKKLIWDFQRQNPISFNHNIYNSFIEFIIYILIKYLAHKGINLTQSVRIEIIIIFISLFHILNFSSCMFTLLLTLNLLFFNEILL